MIKKIVAFVLNSLKVYFFGGFCSLLMLLYLVITDPYFTNLDWKFEKGFEMKLDVFFKLTFYLPIFLMIIYGFLLFLNCKSRVDRLLMFFNALFGIFIFYALDMFLKKIFLISTYVEINILIVSFFYLVIFYSLTILIKSKSFYFSPDSSGNPFGLS
jgi:hypothetical protein